MKKGILNAAILVICLVSLVLNVVMIFTVVPTMQKQANLINRIAEIIDLDVGGDTPGGSDVAITDLASVNITFEDDKNTTNINLKTGADGKQHIVRIGVAVNLNTKHDDYAAFEPTFREKMTMIDAIIIDAVGNYTYEDALNPDKKAEMQNAVLKELQKAFASTFIYSVSFYSFTVQ